MKTYKFELFCVSVIGFITGFAGLCINNLQSGEYTSSDKHIDEPLKYICGWNYATTWTADTDVIPKHTDHSNYYGGSAYCAWCALAISITLVGLIPYAIAMGMKHFEAERINIGISIDLQTMNNVKFAIFALSNIIAAFLWFFATIGYASSKNCINNGEGLGYNGTYNVSYYTPIWAGVIQLIAGAIAMFIVFKQRKDATDGPYESL